MYLLYHTVFNSARCDAYAAGMNNFPSSKPKKTQNNISIILCDHQARDLLSCVDTAIVISNCKIIAKGTPTELINNIDAKNAYFGNSFKIN